jgi:putative redox protein
MATVQVHVNQVGPATAEGVIRDHRVLIDRPEAKGGDDRGAMGGELLLAALGGCFMSNLLEAIRAREAAIDNVQITIDGELASSPSRFAAIAMTVMADHDDRELLEKLVVMSERACIVANTLKGGTELSVSVA